MIQAKQVTRTALGLPLPFLSEAQGLAWEQREGRWRVLTSTIRVKRDGLS